MLTWLYVPGDRPDRFAKAVASGADVVILDLEDAVAPDRKAYARSAVAEFCGSDHPVPIEVRIGSPADIPALVGRPGLSGLRVPKVETADQVLRLAAQAPGVALHCLLESALGVLNAYPIACLEAVASIGLGEADLRSDLGVTSDSGLREARGHVVLAARAARRPRPAMSVYPHVRDLDGLAESCREGRAMGFRGRAAIHPAQLPLIVEAFRPTATEIAHAQAALAAMRTTFGVAVLPDGRFVDRAMIGGAEEVVALAERYGAAEG